MIKLFLGIINYLTITKLIFALLIIFIVVYSFYNSALYYILYVYITI